MKYSIEEHKHRFAAWAAARAASVKGCRFSVKIGKDLLESANINDAARSIENLPNPNEFDVSHRQWRNKIIQISEQHGLNFTHGVAAKLINIYLKSTCICSDSYNDSKVRAIHPPIDSVLLETLKKKILEGCHINGRKR